MTRIFRLTSLALILAVAFFALSTQSPAQAQDARNFYLVNNTGGTYIMHVYVSPSNAEAWSGDILGSQIIEPGQWAYVFFTPTDFETCFYDIWVAGTSGESGVVWGIDLCSTDTVTVS